MIRERGSQKNLADAIGIDRRQVNDWLNMDRKVTFPLALIMQHLMEGKIKIHDLMPLTTPSLKKANKIVQEWWNSYEPEPSLLSIEKILQCNDSIKKTFKEDAVFGLFQKTSERAIIVDHHYHVITGHEQILQYAKRKRPQIRARILDFEALLQGQDKIYELEDLFISEKVAIGIALERFIGNRQGQRKDLQLVQNSAQVKKGQKNRMIIAKIVGLGSHFTYTQAQKVISKGSKNLITGIDNGLIPISNAAQIASLPIEKQEDTIQIIQTKKGKSICCTY